MDTVCTCWFPRHSVPFRSFLSTLRHLFPLARCFLPPSAVIQDTGPEIPFFDLNDDFRFDFSTPVTGQNEDLTSPGPTAEPGERGPDSCPLLYTIAWKLQLRKGRTIKLTEDTIEDVEVAPGAYWNAVLESELATVVESNLPKSQYQPDETTITVSNSKRGEPPFLKRFNKLIIDWTIVENKLRSWSNSGLRLKVAISFIFKEVQPANNGGKTGRGATKKHSAALERLVARQEASGTRAIWRDVYQLFECSSAACTNRGFSCWRYNDKHHKLDSDIMGQLVDYSEQGHELRTHADVPERIRELIHIREDEEARRKQRRNASASNPLPVTVRVFCHGHRDDSSADGCCESQQVQIAFPVPEDKAPLLYSNWLTAKVTNEKWREAYRLAGEITVDKGYYLRWLYTHQKDGKDMLTASGVLEGVAAQFVSRVSEWVNDI